MHTTELSKQFSTKDLTILVLSICLFISAGLLHRGFHKPQLIIPKQESALNINQDFLLFMSIGNKRLIADLLWIQTLLESDLDHYTRNDLNSWMYLRFNTISQLDPKFYENYLFGGQLLSIAKDDLVGANSLFTKGLEFYPNDFELNYYSGFTLYFEMGDFKEGYKRLKRVENHPRAHWNLKYLINKLNFENTKDYDTTIEFLKIHLDKNTESHLKDKLKKDLYAVKAQRDLECLNAKKLECDKFDSEGNRYIFKNGKWESLHQFEKYRIHSQK